MSNLKIHPIGQVVIDKGAIQLKIDSKFRPALTNIDGFTHLQVIWWGNLYDGDQYREHLVAEKPYKKGPSTIGIFATRSPVRPNPILITNIFVEHIDKENGIIKTPYIDAENGSPILDIKPYNLDERIRDCKVPDWCKHWPQWHEESATFNWSAEFNF